MKTFEFFSGTEKMDQKCVMYWPTQEEKNKKFDHVEIIWRGKSTSRKDFTQQNFEIKNENDGRLLENRFVRDVLH